MITSVDTLPEDTRTETPYLQLQLGLLAPVIECPRTAARAMAIPIELATRLDREVTRISEALRDGLEMLDIRGHYLVICSAMERLSAFEPSEATPPPDDILDTRDDFLSSMAHLKAAFHVAGPLLTQTANELALLTEKHPLFEDEIRVLREFADFDAQPGTNNPLRQDCNRILEGVDRLAKVSVMLDEIQKATMALRFSHTHMGRAAARIGSGQALELSNTGVNGTEAAAPPAQQVLAHTSRMLASRDALLGELSAYPAYDFCDDGLVKMQVGLVHPGFGRRFLGMSHTTVQQNLDYAKSHRLPPELIGRVAAEHPSLLAKPNGHFRCWVDLFCKYERLRPVLDTSWRPDYLDVPLNVGDLYEHVLCATQNLTARQAAVDDLIPLTLRNVLDRAGVQPVSIDTANGLSERHYELARQIILHGFVEYAPNGRRYEPVGASVISRRVTKGTEGAFQYKEREGEPVLQILVDHGLISRLPGERKFNYYVLAVEGSPVADHRDTLKGLLVLHRELQLKQMLAAQDSQFISFPTQKEFVSADPVALVERQKNLRELAARLKELVAGRPDAKGFELVLAELLRPEETIGTWTSFSTAPRSASSEARSSFASWKRIAADEEFKRSTTGWEKAFLSWWKAVSVNVFGNLDRTQRAIIDRLNQLAQVQRDEGITFDDFDDLTRRGSEFVNDTGRNFTFLILVSQRRAELLASIMRLERIIDDRERRYKDGR